MQDPDSLLQKGSHTCPKCSNPVEPGNKFCATCGTKIPVLLTCSKCGTQFIHPSERCHLCGAPLILAEIPEPDESPEILEKEKTWPDDDQTPEQDEEDVPEPDTDEVPDDDKTPEQDEEDVPEPDTDEVPDEHDQDRIAPVLHTTPRHYNTEIQEPDTDELLEQFGKEYDEDESLDSLHTPIKPVMVPAQQKRRSHETVDDALFLSPAKPESSAKLRLNKKWIIGGCIILIAIVAALYFIGLPMFRAHYNQSAAVTTPLPEPTINGTVTPTPGGTATSASGAFIPQPTETIPSGQKLYFQVQKNPVTSRILVIFAGNTNEGSLTSAEVKVTHPDGSVTSGTILPLKGVSEITLKGSTEADRVEITAKMSDGKTYRVYDQLVRMMGA